MTLPDPIQEMFAELLGEIRQVRAIGGGCIHHACRISSQGGTFFLKWNELSQADNFAAEEKGLQLLRQAEAFRIPQVVARRQQAGYCGLLMEFIESGSKPARFWQELGEQLARQHRHSQPHFGLEHDNFIGSLPQPNPSHARWADFFREARLGYQLSLPRAQQLVGASLRKQFDALFSRLDSLFPEEPPALLHGDLWGGNLLCDPEGSPVLIDPAVYYGHREAELAFMGLFDSHPQAFYAAYHASYPLAEGWRERLDLYNLYPLLVHVNLFGASYLSGIERILGRFH
jgi:protein-ribulosamine 3-kinase